MLNISTFVSIDQLCSAYNSSTIPMRGFSFSWKRFLGISQIKQQMARETGIPTTQSGLEKKIGHAILKALFGKK